MVRRSLRLKFGLGKSNREMVSTQTADFNPKFEVLLFRSRKDVFCNVGMGQIPVLIEPACSQVQEA